jgi:hypothetical protein
VPGSPRPWQKTLTPLIELGFALKRGSAGLSETVIFAGQKLPSGKFLPGKNCPGADRKMLCLTDI